MSGKLSRRLIISGHDAQGRSRVASDTVMVGDIDNPMMPGAELSVLWGTDSVMRYPDDGARPTAPAFFPPVHGLRLIENLLPANAHYAEAPAGGGGLDSRLSDAASTLEGDRPGMHRTKTIDFIIVMEGRCVVELDEEKVTLNTGDVFIQSGTIHAWHNPFDAPCRFLAVIAGAENELCA
jgi:mannose-6-phosphate isomerase-like protein (cupin superfamily)